MLRLQPSVMRRQEGARGLAVFGQPVLVSELDAQEQSRQLERHLQELKVQIANREDADMGEVQTAAPGASFDGSPSPTPLGQ